MDISIRPFRNTDLKVMCEIWNEHHAAAQQAANGNASHENGVAVEADRMELFVQSKIYFEAGSLLFARLQGDEAVGFVHLCSIPKESQDTLLTDRLGIAALCVRPGDWEDDVAASLLNAAHQHCLNAGARRLIFRPASPLCSFYVGLGPAGSMASVLSTEVRLCRWLGTAGFKPAIPTTVWELPLERFRVPGDRIQILVRRRSAVDRQLQEPTLPWWQSCVLGHAETTAFHLFDRVHKRVLQEIVLWSLAPSLTDTGEKIAWMWPPKMEYSAEDAPVEIAPVDRLVFLLAEALRDLQQEHVEAVQTITYSEANQMHQGLQRLGFSATESGMVFEKDLT